MSSKIICELCGGTEFYKASGYYYCNECQTQTQAIREQVFDTTEAEVDIEETVKKTTNTKEKKRKIKIEEQLTTWECYNCILVGLVNELLQLGANPKLKQVVKFLWFKYLKKMEVINNTGKPKLQALNSKIDAAIIYGRLGKRKRKSSSSSTSHSDVSSSKVLRGKKKKAMAIAEYEEFTQQSTQDTTLINQSLDTLKSSADSETKTREKYLQYNRYAKQALLKTMTEKHLIKHRKDVHSVLNCHSATYRRLSRTYSGSATLLSRNKLYGILYLGLLLIKDNIQLGDLMRFIREGHLSYNHIEHFFPEEYARRTLSIKSYAARTMLLTSKGLRQITARIAVFLDVSNLIPLQNLPQLYKRYCKELNLPDVMVTYGLKYLSWAKCVMKITVKTKIIPNYEARAISFIIFLFKLLFGLDDATEYYLTKFAERVNIKTKNEKMFVLKNWLEYIKYRRLILSKHHFPTQFLYDKNFDNPDLYVNLMTDLNEKIEHKDLSVEYDILKQLLEKLKKLHPDQTKNLIFEPSLTPFRDYIKIILDEESTKTLNYSLKLLKTNFENNSLDFLMCSGYYLKLLGESKVKLNHRGVNENLQALEIRDYKNIKNKQKKADFVFVKLVDSDHEQLPEIADTNHKQCDTKKSLNTFYNINQKQFEANNAQRNLHSKEKYPKEDLNEIFVFEENHHYTNEHFNPEERYWLLTENVNNLNKIEFNKFIEMYPNSFRIVLSECARIIEQSERELFEEFNYLELYMTHLMVYGMPKHTRRKFKQTTDVVRQRMIKKAQTIW